MTSKHFHITGPPAFGPNVPVRKEFNDFVKDADVLNLYLLALERIQNADQATLTSFFQIGGIHGLPYIPWDNVQGLTDPTFGGYCTHGSVIFPTWHRPYVALYEQVIWTQASVIASSYEDPALKDKYQEAVKRLRQPYWDWASIPTLHPLLNTTQTVSVVAAPKGDTKEIRNPLISYPFHPVDPSFPTPYSAWPQTLRYATNDTSDAQSQPNLVQDAFNKSEDQLRDSIFHLLASIHDWLTFSNHTSSGNSLEAIHDQVHLLIGGNGQMAYIPLAGFDPIFYIHHCNVDRMLSLWQALNPTLWVVPGSSDDGSFTIAADQTVDVNTDLTPFHVDDTTFWNSANLRSTKSFGYTYPEISDPNASPEQIKENVTRAVMALYGPQFDAGSATSSASVAVESLATKAKSVTSGNPTSNPGHGTSNPGSGSTPIARHPNRYHDWYAEVTVNPYQFSNSGYVHLFLSKAVPEGNWLAAPERVGDAAIFRNISGQCANCNQREAAGQTITAHVPLTSALLKRGKDINDVEGMEEYLRTHLHWRCALVNGNEVPLDSVPSLQVKVFSALCERAEKRGGFEGFPRRHAPETHRSATHGKVGGYSESG